MATQTKAAFTPGPWHLNGNAGWSELCKDRGKVFECNLRTGTHVPADQNEANARLIAEAPEMARLLRQYVAICEAERGRTDITNETRALLSRIGYEKP